MKDEVQSGYKPVQDDVLTTLGLAVITGYGVECLMKICLRFPLHDGPLQTVEQLQTLLERHSKATLGQLIRVLQQRVDLHPSFSEQLDRFLEDRNLIAHRLHEVPGGLDLHSDEGRERLKAFLLQYMDNGRNVSMVFLGLLREWTSHEDINLPGEYHLSQKMRDDIDAHVVPNLEDLIKLKERGAQPSVSDVD